MKAKPFQINALSTQIQSTFKAALIFGTDIGVIQDSAEKVALKIVSSLKDDFNVIKVFQSQLKEHPSLLTDEGNTISFMGGRRLIWLKDADAQATEAVLDFITNIKSDSFLLITSGNLTKSSTLRIEAETNPSILTIACYEEDEKNIKRNMFTFFQENGYKISSETLSLLCDRLIENRISLKSELNKLITYLGERRNITNDDIRNVISLTSSSNIDFFCQCVASNQIKKTDLICTQLLQSGESSISLIRCITTYFNLLLLGRQMIKKQMALETVLSKILRPNQFKMKEILTQQLYIWDIDSLTKVLNLLFEAEKQMKTTGYDQDLILQRTLTLIYSAAKNLYIKRN